MRGAPFVLAAAVLAFGAPEARAREEQYLYRGSRQMAMGGAGVALADDASAVFVNPAGLAGVRKYSVHYLAADVDLSTDIISTVADGTDAFQSPSGDAINAVMGKNIYGRVQLSPTVLIPNLGISFLLDGQGAMFAKNKALPQVRLGYQVTNGVQAGFGYSLLRHGRRARRMRSDVRVGIAAKYLFRRGGYYDLPTSTLFRAGEGKTLLGDIVGNFESGVGLDLGVQFIHALNQRLRLLAGVTYTDAGDTAFGGKAAIQRQVATLGAALQYDMDTFMASLAYDYRGLTSSEDFLKKNHLGLELKFPVVSVYGGVNQVYLTGGVDFDLWLFRISALTYAEELGTFARQDPNRRYMLRVEAKFHL